MNLEKGPSNKDIESFTLRLKNPNYSPAQVSLGCPYVLITFEKDGEISVKIDPILIKEIEVTKWDFR